MLAGDYIGSEGFDQFPAARALEWLLVSLSLCLSLLECMTHQNEQSAGQTVAVKKL